MDQDLLAELGLSEDEARRLLLEQKKDRAERRERDVKDFVEELQNEGVPPAFCTAAEEIMLADDGQPALLLSQDSTSGVQQLTASDIVRRLAAGIKGVKLDQEQVTDRERLGSAPPNNTDGENKSVDERAGDVRSFLGIDDSAILAGSAQ